MPSVVDDDGGCGFEGPACDGIGVGSGHMAQREGDVVDLVFRVSFASVFILLFPGPLERLCTAIVLLLRGAPDETTCFGVFFGVPAP